MNDNNFMLNFNVHQVNTSTFSTFLNYIFRIKKRQNDFFVNNCIYTENFFEAHIYLLSAKKSFHIPVIKLKLRLYLSIVLF